MLFEFLKYLQPTNYFSLIRKNGDSIFPDIEALPREILDQLDPDNGFLSTEARHYDLSWQAIGKGYIGDCKTYRAFEALPLEDNYRFCRKYFHSLWVFYILVFRILSFKV